MIEISPSGHLVLSFHMGLDKLFSSRLAVRAVFDPSFTTMNKTKRELISFDSSWSCDAAELDVWLMHFAVLKVLSVAALNVTICGK